MSLTRFPYFINKPAFIFAKTKTMKYKLVLAALLFTTAASAQLQKGEWTISTGLNAPFNLGLTSNGEGTRSHNFAINPMAGYFIKDQWEVGGGPQLSFSGTRIKDETGKTIFKTNSQSYGINFYTRYYLKKEGKLIPYLTANLGYIRSKGTTTDFAGSSSSFKLNRTTWGAGAGLAWFVGPRSAIFSELTYSGLSGGGSGYTGGVNLRVGFQFFFGRKN
jgi:outer membrane autotransporter protein